MPDIRQILKDRDRYVDSMLQAFEQHLQEILTRSQLRVQAQLQRKLVMADGQIDRTPGNMRVLRSIDKLFVAAMDEYGYQSLVESFAAEFPQQLPYVHQIMEQISAQMQEPLPPLNLTAKDRAVLVAQQAATVDQLGDIVQFGAAVAKQRAMLAVGGLTFDDLSTIIADQCEVTMSRAKTLADTSMSVWYRTANEQAFAAIEKDVPGIVQKYEYAGPDDAKTRPFCDHLMRGGKAYTRDQIDGMSNGQLMNVFVTGGGYNCRHTWLLSVRDLKARYEASKAA